MVIGDYTRKGLTGLGKNDQEQWITDPRIPEQFQLPDVFYTRDNGAFDKGHIVRREDVCWGSDDFTQIQRANGDTFHTTNCSPQVADYNRSNQKGLWGLLENYIQKQAGTQTFSLFAGPVLLDTDKWFEGKDLRGAVKVQIPEKFWKIVAAQSAESLHAYGFLLEQDLSNVPLEDLKVDATWSHKMIGIEALEKLLQEVTFPSELKDADQSATSVGQEMLRVTGIPHIAWWT